VVEKTLHRLGKEYEGGGRTQLFEALRPFLDPSAELDHAAAAKALNVSEGALRQAIFRIRQRFRQIIREEVADTLVAPDEELVSEELRVIQRSLIV
jgi:RNA polymerase sigma-70 factor (ECF subfamily)